MPKWSLVKSLPIWRTHLSDFVHFWNCLCKAWVVSSPNVINTAHIGSRHNSQRSSNLHPQPVHLYPALQRVPPEHRPWVCAGSRGEQGRTQQVQLQMVLCVPTFDPLPVCGSSSLPWRPPTSTWTNLHGDLRNIPASHCSPVPKSRIDVPGWGKTHPQSAQTIYYQDLQHVG